MAIGEIVAPIAVPLAKGRLAVRVAGQTLSVSLANLRLRVT